MESNTSFSHIKSNYKTKSERLLKQLEIAKHKLQELELLLQEKGQEYRRELSKPKPRKSMMEFLGSPPQNVTQIQNEEANTSSEVGSAPPLETKASETEPISHLYNQEKHLPSTSKQGARADSSNFELSVLDRIGRPRPPKKPSEPNAEAAQMLESILASGYDKLDNTDPSTSTNVLGNGVTRQEVESRQGKSSTPKQNPRELENAEVMVTDKGNRVSTRPSPQESEADILYAAPHPHYHAKAYLQLHKMMESLYIKLKQLDRKLCGIEKRKLLENNKKNRPLQLDDKDDRVERDTLIPKEKQSIGVSTPKKWIHSKEMNQSDSRAKSPMKIPKLKKRRKEVYELKFKPDSNTQAGYWKDKADLVFKALLQERVKNKLELDEQLSTLAPPNLEVFTSFQDENGYWATQMKRIFEFLLKQKNCDPEIWKSLTPYVTMEEALGHLIKDRKRSSSNPHRHGIGHYKLGFIPILTDGSNRDSTY